MLLNDDIKYCKLINSNKIYTVEKILDKKIYLRFKNSLITTDVDNVVFIDKNSVSKKQSTCTISLESNNVPNEIMLRHKLKETAIQELDKYIDQAMIAKLGRIRIIHGKRGGVLRAAVHEYLTNHPYIKDFHIADYTEGGIGVTIAYIGKK